MITNKTLIKNPYKQKEPYQNRTIMSLKISSSLSTQKVEFNKIKMRGHKMRKLKQSEVAILNPE